MKFMVEITFPPRPTDPAAQAALMALIPREQAHVAELQRAGVVDALYVGAEGAQVWVAMAGASADEVARHVDAFPLRPHMASVRVVPLR